MDQDATCLCLRDIVLDGNPAPSPLKRHSPPFSVNVRCGQTAGWTKMALSMEVGLGPGDFVSDWDPATPRKEGTPTPTKFLAHVYCGQTAGWMKTLLATEVDLGPGHIVLDGVSALRERGTAAPPNFSAHVYYSHGRPSQLLLSSCISSSAFSLTLAAVVYGEYGFLHAVV